MKASESPTTTRKSLKYGSRHSIKADGTKISSVDTKEVLIKEYGHGVYQEKALEESFPMVSKHWRGAKVLEV